MASTTQHDETETAPARQWFRGWLRKHKVRNPHARFVQYEADGDDVYQGWIMAFEERHTTRREAVQASRILQAKAPIKGLLPEHHLPRLLAILAQIQGPRLVRAEADRREAARAEAERVARVEARDRKTWAMLPESIRASYRQEVLQSEPVFRRFPGMVDMMARLIWIEELNGVQVNATESQPGRSRVPTTQALAG